MFLISSGVFLLIGSEVGIDLLLDNVLPVLVAIVAILVARTIVVYGLRPIIDRRGDVLPWKWAYVTFWGGLREGLGNQPAEP